MGRVHAAVWGITLAVSTACGCGGTASHDGSGDASLGSETSAPDSSVDDALSSDSGSQHTLDGAPSVEAGGDSAIPANTVGGCPLFPASSLWHQRVDSLPLDPNHAAYENWFKNHLDDRCLNNGGTTFHTYFPGAFYFNVVPSGQPLVPVSTTESLRGFSAGGAFVSDLPHAMPLDSSMKVEGPNGVNNGLSGDRHMVVVESGSCTLWELYAAHLDSTGWHGETGVRWDLGRDETLPDGTGSTTAAGDPIFPGYIRYDEVVSAAGIDHALTFQASIAVVARIAFTHPASQREAICASPTDPGAFPYGGRLRLKSSYSDPSAGPQANAVIRALKEYGAFLDDVGCCFTFRLVNDPRWNAADMAALDRIDISDFEVPMFLDSLRNVGPVCANAGCQ